MVANNKYSRGEGIYRKAFERLKLNKPSVLPKGTKVTQNNVAREAGKDPSALRKARYPTLVLEIQQWIDQNQDQTKGANHRTKIGQRGASRSAKERLRLMKDVADKALARLVEAEAKVVELTQENNKLKAMIPSASVASLRSMPKAKHLYPVSSSD